MSRYDSLATLLEGRPHGVVDLSFDEIDDAVGGLPPSARRYREWWANSESSQGRAWQTPRVIALRSSHVPTGL